MATVDGHVLQTLGLYQFEFETSKHYILSWHAESDGSIKCMLHEVINKPNPEMKAMFLIWFVRIKLAKINTQIKEKYNHVLFKFVKFLYYLCLFLFMAVLVCGHSGLWSFQSVAFLD